MNKKKQKHYINGIFLVSLFFCLTFAIAKPVFSSDKENNLPNDLLIKYKGINEIQVFHVSKNVKLEKIIFDYSKNSLVEYVEPDFGYKAAMVPNDSYASKQWYFKKIKTYDAWDIVRESPNIVIAVIDSGVYTKHPDLRDNIWINKKEIAGNGVDDDKNGFIDDVNGWDFVANSADPSPKFEEGFTENGIQHGTVVAGIIGASGNNAAGVSGVTWRAQIMPLRVLDGKGEGSASKVVKAIDYAIGNGADIINLSFVGFNYSKSLDEAIKRAYDAGIIVVAAAGNEQSDGEGYNIDDVPMYPACNDGMDGENRVIGVAALDAIDQKAIFSSYGTRCVDISAPGVGIYSTTVFNPDKYVNGHSLNTYYDGYWSGTSMAAPMVAGAIALVEQINPSYNHNEIVNNILRNTDNIARLNPTYINKLGSGRLNIFLATHFAQKALQREKNLLLYSPMSSFSGTSTISFSEMNGKKTASFAPFGASYHGAINGASGDVDGDGEAETVIISPTSSVIRIFDHHNKYEGQFKTFSSDYSAINISIGDLDQNKTEEIVVSANTKKGNLIKIFNYRGVLISQFFSYNIVFQGGVNLAIGDVDGDVNKEIVVAPGKGGGPQVKIYKMNGKLQSQFFVYDKNFRGGVKVATAHIFYGARGNRNRIIVSPISGGGPHIRIFNNYGVVENQFFAFSNNFRGGVSLAAGDLNNDGFDEIIAGAGPGGSPHIRIFTSQGELLNSFYAYDQNYQGGVNVFTNK